MGPSWNPEPPSAEPVVPLQAVPDPAPAPAPAPVEAVDEERVFGLARPLPAHPERVPDPVIPGVITPVADRQVAFAAPDIDDADIEAVIGVLMGGWLTSGNEVAALQAELASYLGAPYVVVVSSATAALELALTTLDLRPGARVAVPAWTFAATALAAVHAGTVPVLVDVDADTLNMDPRSLAATLATGVDAVVPVHFGGVPVSHWIHDLSRVAGVPVVEDAAHAFGAWDQRGLLWGKGSTAACFSFYATKNLTCGEGGALATEDAEVARRVRAMRLHGLSADAWARYQPGAPPADYDIAEPGIKANLPDVLAGLARSQLRRFDQLQARRRALVDHYRARLADVPGLRWVPQEVDPRSAHHLAVIVLPDNVDRRTVQLAMRDAGVGTSVHFKPLHRYTWFREHAEVGPTGVATCEALADRVLSLPLHPRLTPQDVNYVCDVLVAQLHR
ncbi:MAG: DegT/DnrJ/EryC1/StrS family aminotransferase [Actinobacteria bacterium]|nr:MAG: DegT/DnrJ/EryC1/StrS family aminotransferase [Actinomycetota bacterium]